MAPGRSLARARIEDEPTPDPESAVARVSQPAPPVHAVLAYFADPTPGMRAMDAAWEEALALYGDEDSDAWVAALESGTHPLCRVAWPAPSA